MDALTKLFQKGKTVTFKKNQLLMAPHKKPRGIYKITEGFIVTYLKSPSQKKKIQTIFKKGDMFPLTWAIHNITANVYAEAVTDGSTQLITKKDFLSKVMHTQEAAVEIISFLLMYVRTYMERVENLEYETVRKKVISRLLLFADRFGRKDGKSVVVELPITHKFIAESINVSRENVTREFKFLEKMKLISFKNHQLILYNLKQLQKELTEGK